MVQTTAAEALSQKVVGLTLEHKLALASVDVTSTDQLIERAAHRNARRKLSADIGIEESEILEWMNRVDLMRIEGVDSYYADLLEEAGVDTVPELAQRNAEHLHQKMLATIEETPFIVDEAPSLEQITTWIETAKTLERLIEY